MRTIRKISKTWEDNMENVPKWAKKEKDINEIEPKKDKDNKKN